MSRYRETTSGSLSTPYNLESRWWPSDVHQANHPSYGGTEVVKSIRDVEVPGFRALQKCGKFLPLNPCEIVETTRSVVPATMDLISNISGFRYIGQYCYATPSGLFPSTPLAPEQAYIDAAVLAAKSNAASDKWDFLTFIAELRGTTQVMSQLGSAFNARTLQLATEAAAFKRNPWKRFRELWLGARYSIRPLVYDFIDGAKAIDRLVNQRAFLKGTGKQETLVEDETDSGWVDFTGGFQKRETFRKEISLTYRGASYISVESVLDSALLFDPLVTAYELASYSFIVDKFINIGAWVSALTPTLRGDFLGTQYSLKEESLYRYTYEERPKPGTTSEGTFSAAVNTLSINRYVREPYDGLPFPSLLPDVTLPLLVDLVTLFVKGRNSVTRVLNRR